MSLLPILAQVPIPQEGDNPWIWLCGALLAALVYVTKQWVSGNTDALKRERDQNDKLTATLPELISLFREWKEAQRGHNSLHES